MESLSDLTAKCIRCGFCLQACPTFVITGKETESPRGRIYLARSVEQGQLEWTEDAAQHIDSCLGCRACEPACPSGVEYGKIFEIARDQIEARRPNRAKGALLSVMTRPGLFAPALALGRMFPGRRIPAALSRLLSGEAPEAAPPQTDARNWPPLDESSLPPVTGHVALLEGCVMRVLYPRVNEATRRLLRRVGLEVLDCKAGCCGALHAHNGYLEHAHQLAKALERDLPPDVPVVVNSAGCGSAMKEFAGEFAGRVLDASEILHAKGLTEALAKSPGFKDKVTYHDACHLAHGQRITHQPRELLSAIPGIEMIPLEESDRCCGSAGIYNLTQPKLARALLERKYERIQTTGAKIVATGNPGCQAWIAQAAREKSDGIRVLHTMELLEPSFIGGL